MTTSKQAICCCCSCASLPVSCALHCSCLHSSAKPFFFPVLVRVPALPCPRKRHVRTLAATTNGNKDPQRTGDDAHRHQRKGTGPLTQPPSQLPREPPLFFSCASCKTNPYQPRNSTSVSTLINGQTKTKCASSTYSVVRIYILLRNSFFN